MYTKAYATEHLLYVNVNKIPSDNKSSAVAEMGAQRCVCYFLF